MNRIFKVIWSKAKNCYVVASELAKSHTKSPKSGVIGRSVVAGVLACVLSCEAVMPVYADTFPALYDTDNYSSGGSVSVTGSTASSNAFTNVSNSTNLTVNGDISASNFSVVGSPSSNYQQYIPAGTGTFVCKADNTNVKTVTVSGIGLSNFSDTITFNERRFASIVDFIHYIDSTSIITSVAPGNTYSVRGTSLSGDGIHSGNLYSNGVSYNGSPYLGGNGGIISVIYDSSGRIYLGGSSGSAGIVGIQGADGKALVPSTSSSPGFLVELVNKGDYYETKTLLAQRGLKPGETEGLGTYSRTYATVGEELSIVGDYSPTITVSGSSALNVTGSANLEDGKLAVTDSSSVSTTGDLQAKTVSLSNGSTVTSGGTVSAKSVSDTGTGSSNTLSATKVETTEGDINTPNTDVTATDAVESAGVVKLKSLNAPRLLGAGSGMSTLGGGLTVAGQVKGVTAGTADTDAVNLKQLNNALTNVVTTDSVYQDDNYNVFVYGDKYSSQNQTYHYNTNINAILGLWMTSGDNSYTQGASESVAIGHGTIVAGNRNIGIGNVDIRQYYGNPVQSKETSQSVAIGYGSKIQGSSNSIVLGPYASVVGNDNSIALGYASQASGENAIALGSRSIADVANTVSVGSYYLNRRIVNVADGIDDTDVATWGQTKTETRPSENGNYVMSDKTGAENLVALDGQLKTTTDSLEALGDSSVLYDGTDKSAITLGGGESGTVISNVKAGTLSADSTEAVNGSQLYSTNEAIAREVTDRQNAITTESGARETADTALSNRIGTLASDGNYITASGTVSANISALDTNLKSTADALATEVSDRTTAVSNEATARQDADTALSNRIGTLSADGTYILKDNSVSVNLSALDTGLKAEKDAREAAVSAINAGITSLSGNAVQYTDDTKAIVALGGTDGTTISNVKAGTLSATSTEAVTGSQLFTTNTNLANETTARETADTALGGRIDTEITDRTNADTVLDNKIAAETTARENAISQLTQSISDLGGNAVQYDSTDKSAITLGGGESGTVIANVKAGTLSADSTEAVNGSQLYSTNQALAQEVTDRTTAVSNEAAARESADTALDGRIGVIAEDGEYIKKSSTNSIAANLSILDLRMKANADDISGLKDLSNITGSGETVIRNLAKGSVKVASGNYTNIVKGTDGNADSYTVNVIANGEAAEGNTGLMTGGAVYTAVKGAVDAFSPANISDAAAAQWAERLGTGVVAQDSSGLISGKTLYNEVHVADGNVIRATNTVGQNLSALDAGLKTVGTDVAGIKANAIQYDDASKTAITLGNGTNVTTIRNVAAGELSSASKDAVNGGQLYSVRDKLQKADGIDKGKWQEVLGDGQVELDNTGLVTGDTVYKAIKATAATASVRMIGINSNDKNDVNYSGGGAVGKDAVAVGSGVEAKGDNAVAMGKDSKAEGVQSVAIGHGSQALGLQSVVIGTSNKVTGNHSGAFGDPNYVTGDNSYAFGNNNSVSGSNTFVLGNNVKASGKNSVVLGAGSDGSEDNVVSVGAKGNERRITHVADGQTMTDAATVGQLSRLAQVADDGLRYLDRRVNKAGTGAAALAALHPLDMDGKFGMAAGYGNYHSTHAMALGLFYQPKDNVMFSIGGTIGNGDNMINAGVSIALDKGFTNSKAAMARNIRNLTAENAAMKEKLEAQGNEIKELKEMLMQLKSQMQKQ